MKKLFTTYSLLAAFLECEHKWFYSYMCGLEKKQWKEPFLMGTVFQYGIFQLMKTKDAKLAQIKMEKFLVKYIEDLRNKFVITTDDEKHFVEMKAALKGMLYGYYVHYKRDLEVEKHIANEQEDVYKIADVLFRIKMDNVVMYKNNWYLHEGKTWRYLSNERVNNAIKSLQIATYFYLHNDNIGDTGYKQFKGIIFDAVQKPSIKQRIGESYRGYLSRLEDYYSNADSNSKFYKEVFIKPAIAYDDWLNTITVTSTRMQNMLYEKSKPTKTYVNCDMCDYNTLCYEGNTKQNLLMYQKNKYILELRKET